MSHDGATAGHDAAVTRSVYGHPASSAFRLGHTSTRMLEQHYAGRLDRADLELARALDAAARLRHVEESSDADVQ
jgi:hypothetical protein